MYGQNFKIVSQKQEYINNFCIDYGNDFHFACRQ